MRVSSGWGLAGLVVVGLFLADLVTHPTGTAAAFGGATTLESNVGSQLLGSATAGTPVKGG